MKQILQLCMCLLVLSGTFLSCGEEVIDTTQLPRTETSDYVKKLDASIPDFVSNDMTRTTVITDENGKLQLVWEVNDTIGIFPDEGFQVAFSMADGAGSKNATFDGGGWGLKASSTYSAYYPLIGQFYLDKTKIPMKMGEQVQEGNSSFAHIGTTDYMAAINAQVDDNGSVSFQFQHLVSVLHMRFALPNAANVTKVMLLTNGSFTTEATLNLTDGTVTPKAASATQTLSLKDVSVAEGELLEVYMNILPVDLTNNDVYAKIFDDQGVCYTATVKGKAFEAGTIYNIGKVATVDKAYASGLPIVFINTPDATAITSKTDWMDNASIVIQNTDGTTDYISNALKIRGRGNSTWSYPKKPYALKLDKKAKILGMPKHKRWCLLANWMDRTLMRNDVTFQIARQTGLAWTPRGQFVEVILNGTHMGNYYLCEQIKVDENRVNITEMKATDLEGDAITGGYLMELDVYYDEVNKFKSATKTLPYMFKDPDEDVLQPAQLTWFENYINEMEAKMYADNWLTNREYADYMDLASFVDWWFVYELAKNGEPNHPKSCYMHKDRNGKLTAGPVWDFDWGTYTPGASFTIKNSIYYGRLFSDPVFVALVKERWSLHKSKFDQIPDYVRTVAAKIKSSNEVDKAIWPMTANSNGSVNGDRDMTFDEAVERLISAYETKLAWLNTQINNM